MKSIYIAAGIIALAVGFGSFEASAQGRSNGGGNGGGMGGSSFQGGGVRGLDRADSAAGSYGYGGRAQAPRPRCQFARLLPSRARKKAGLGSRFRC